MAQGLREFVVYTMASAAALAADVMSLSLLVEVLHWDTVAAAAAAFLIGAAVVYVLSVRFAFSVRRVRDHRMEFAIFMVIGCVGLAITMLVMWLGAEQLHFDYRLCKLVAAGLSFAFNFAFRKLLLFRHK